MVCRCRERRTRRHELLFHSQAKLKHIAREKREAQMPNEFSREGRQINLPSRRSLTRNLRFTCLSLLSLPHLYIYLFFPCAPLGVSARFLSPFQPTASITLFVFPLYISHSFAPPLLVSVLLFSRQLLNPREEPGSPSTG